MLNNQFATFVPICTLQLAPITSETRTTKGRGERGGSLDEKHTIPAESMMTNHHDWLHWREPRQCSFQMTKGQFSLSFFSFSLSFFPYFFPKGTRTTEVYIYYKLETPTINLCALKPASPSFMKL